MNIKKFYNQNRMSYEKVKQHESSLKQKWFRYFSFLILSSFLLTSLYSCKDFLSIDDYFSDELKLDSVFSNERYLKAYMWGAASMFPDEGNFLQNNYTPGPLATDEAFTSFYTTHGYNGISYVLGEITSGSMKSFNTWGNLYQIIRKCNTIFNRIDEAADLKTKDRFEIIGTTRFIRAYAYYNIIVDYGPPILLGDEVMESNEALPYYDRPRSTYDEAIEYVCNELEEAAMYLPVSVPLMEFGVPTQGAANGLIARLRLIHASPLYNGGDAARRTFGDWKRSSDNVQYVSQVYDEKRWAMAAAAAKKVMDMQGPGGQMFKLHVIKADSETPELPTGITSDPNYYKEWPDGAAGLDHLKSYSDMFNGESVIPANQEYVWGRRSGAITANTQMAFPQKLGGWNAMCITQKVIDTYSMYDGRSIDNSSTEYPYSETGFTGAIKTFSDYRQNAGISNMYNNREMRFYASVGFSEAFWPMRSSTSSGQYNQTIAYYYDSPNGKGGVDAPQDHPITGYVIKKFIHPNDAWTGTNSRRMDKGFGIVRYADILLSYAEALNNLTASHTVEVDGQQQAYSRDMNEIMKAFNQVRYRAGLPGMNGSEDAKTVQSMIEKERMLEFLFENRRYYDVRRWGIYEETESVPIKGMNIEGPKEVFYSKVIPNTSRIGARIVNRRLVLMPIPLREVRILPSLDQNPGWED